MKASTISKIENATVKLLSKGGQGILVKNEMILTAGHCIEFSTSGAMALGDYYLEEIETKQGLFNVSPLCIEPLSDIAVLGQVDSQELNKDYELFEEFCRIITPIKICKDKLEIDKDYEIFILTHEKKWITGTAKLYFPDSPVLSIKADEPIKGGTSGSGIYNKKGEIMGVVSWASEQTYDGCAPRPLLALPTWICKKVL